MDIRELRIGNLVNNCGQICFVMGIYKSNKIELGYFKDSIGFIRSLDDLDIKPIPLTEEIISKTNLDESEYIRGFEVQLTNYYDGNYYAMFHYFSDGGYSNEEEIISEPLMYLHQLQNLYFALTGEELTYEP